MLKEPRSEHVNIINISINNAKQESPVKLGKHPKQPKVISLHIHEDEHNRKRLVERPQTIKNLKQSPSQRSFSTRPRLMMTSRA